MKKIVIGICTYKRNELLDICLRHIEKLCLPQNVQLEIVVVDNSHDAQAKDLVESRVFAGSAGSCSKIHYSSFTGKGIAAVRNETLRQVRKLSPDYIALIDDDEYPGENWLIELYERITTSGADVVTGPFLPAFVDTNFQSLDVPSWIKNNSLFEGKSKRADGVFCETARTNNVMFKAEILDKLDFWFDERYLYMTGEDLDFFDRINTLGYKIVWCKNAPVFDIINPKRCTLSFIWDRNFNNGYLRIFNKKKKNNLKFIHYPESFFNLFMYAVIFPISLICGLTIFCEMFGKVAFSLGAVLSLFKKETIVHYKD